MKRFLVKIFLILFCPAVVLSQPTIKVFTGLYYPATTGRGLGDGSLEKYWKPIINTGARTSFQLANWIDLTPSFSYDYYFYHRYYQETSTGEKFVVSAGEGSHIFRTILALQLIDQSDDKAKPYVEVGGGYVIEIIGKIHGYWEYPGLIEYSSDPKSVTNKYFAYSVGAGIGFYLSRDFNLDVSAKYFSNRTERFYYLFGFYVAYKIFNQS